MKTDREFAIDHVGGVVGLSDARRGELLRRLLDGAQAEAVLAETPGGLDALREHRRQRASAPKVRVGDPPGASASSVN